MPIPRHAGHIESAAPCNFEGDSPWDPGGRLLRKQTLNPKRPIEAMDTALGIDTHNKSD